MDYKSISEVKDVTNREAFNKEYMESEYSKIEQLKLLNQRVTELESYIESYRALVYEMLLLLHKCISVGLPADTAYHAFKDLVDELKILNNH